MTMLAFHSNEANKSKILRQLRAHAKADEIVKGQYWENGKGCAVGCTVHSSKHVWYESRFGIPQALARLEDVIFEGLPNAKAKEWPVAFMLAIRPGANLSRVRWQFLHWMLTDEKHNPGIGHPLVQNAIKRCAEVMSDLARGKRVTASAARSAASAAWSAARSAAWSAESAARSAESAARSAESAESAASAARSAESAESAASAAWSAESAARSAASAAWSAESAARSAESAARSARAYVRMSKKLLELLAAA